MPTTQIIAVKLFWVVIGLVLPQEVRPSYTQSVLTADWAFVKKLDNELKSRFVKVDIGLYCLNSRDSLLSGR